MTPLDPRLTAREEQVAELLRRGLIDKEIAALLDPPISAKVVSKHVSSVIGKLGAGNRTEAAVLWDRTRREAELRGAAAAETASEHRGLARLAAATR